MSELFHKEDEPQLICWDRSNYVSVEKQLEALKNSRTVYVGNLSFFSTEQQLLETFSTVGPVKRLIMGVNSISKTPCGFCFVEYYTMEHFHAALKFINETVCDGRIIRCDADAGFLPGRQFGRGKSGGQFRDERKTDFDPARGRFVPPEVVGLGKRGRGRDRDYDHHDDRNDKYGRSNSGREGRGRGGRDREYNRDDDQYRGRDYRERAAPTLDSGLHSTR